MLCDERANKKQFEKSVFILNEKKNKTSINKKAFKLEKNVQLH